MEKLSRETVKDSSRQGEWGEKLHKKEGRRYIGSQFIILQKSERQEESG